MPDARVDLYELLAAGDSWECPRCGRRTKQYPALSHVRDEQKGESPQICSDCGDDEDFQMWMDGSPPTSVRHWPVRRELGSMRYARPRRAMFGPNACEADLPEGVRAGVYWDGKLEEWLTTLLALSPDSSRQPEGLQTWSFPTRRLLDEYLASVAERSEHDVRQVLRHLLFDGATFSYDDDLYRALLAKNADFEALSERYEYFRRLPLTVGGRVHAHPGVRWVIDLLPDTPGRAAAVIESYIRAHTNRLAGGRNEGLSDAIAVINAYYIGNNAMPWREALLSVSPRQFECLIARLYAAMGFDVLLTPPTPDGGRDVIATKWEPGGKQKLLVECKLYSSKVGVGRARELLGLVSHEHATSGVLVTTSSGTRGVHSLADANARFDFVDGPRLVVLLNEYLGSQWSQRLDWLTREL